MTSGDLRDAFDGIAAAVELMTQDGAMIRAAYEAMPRDRLKEELLVEYRCPNKKACLLLHAWGRDLTFYYVKDYKLSTRRTEDRTVASARAKNTLDGYRHFRPRAGRLEDFRGWGESVGLDLQCDHLDPVVVRAGDIFADAARATRGRPFRRFVTAQFGRVP